MKITEDNNKLASEELLKVEFDPDVRVRFASSLVESLIKLVPDFKGAWMFSKVLLFFFPRSLRQVTVEFSRQSKSMVEMTLDVADPPQFTMVKKHRYDLGTVLTVWHLLKKDNVVFDVGANCGYITNTASLKVGDGGVVVSIEPNREAFNSLMNRGLGNIFPLNCVGSDISGRSFQMKKKFYRQTTSGFFIETSKGGIKSISLDTIYSKMNKPSVRLIKIDSEGAELNIIMGAKQLLTEKNPYLIVEVEEVHLKRYGYTLKDFEEFMSKLGYMHFYFINDADASVVKIEALGDGQILLTKDALSSDIFEV